VLGPVLFAIDERVTGNPPRETVKLRAVEYKTESPLEPGNSKQPAFETIAVWGDEVPKLDKTGLIPVVPEANKPWAFDLTSSLPIKLTDPVECKRILSPSNLEICKENEPGPAVSLVAKKTIHVDVTNMPKGDYRLTIFFSYEDRRGKELRNNWVVNFRIR